MISDLRSVCKCNSTIVREKNVFVNLNDVETYWNDDHVLNFSPQLNYVTKWSVGKRDKFNEKCFSRFIELAMPKLKSQLDVRLQNSANANGRHSNGAANGFHGTNGHSNGGVRPTFPLWTMCLPLLNGPTYQKVEVVIWWLIHTTYRYSVLSPSLSSDFPTLILPLLIIR